MKTCEFIVEWDVPTGGPKRHCATTARWRYPAMSGGHMYLCDEHAIPHMDYAEAAPPGGWDSPVARSTPGTPGASPEGQQ